MIKLIIFDYDGVIVNSFKTVYEVYKTICKELGVDHPKNIEVFRNIYGYNLIECHKNLGIAQKNFKKSLKIFEREIVKKNPKLFRGIKHVLKTLNKNYILIQITANHKKEALQKLKKYDLLKYFSYVDGAEGQKRFFKPKVINQIAKKYKARKNEIIYIGDRNVDYSAGKKAGLKNILIVDYGWGYDKNKIPRQKYIIKKPEGLLKAIKHINLLSTK